MEEIIQLFRRLKKTKSQQNGLNLELASPPDSGHTTASADGLDDVIVTKKSDLQKAKFRLKRPRLTSPTEKRIQRRIQAGSSTASSTRSSASDGGGGQSEAAIVANKCRAGSPFADEDDLFADRDQGEILEGIDNKNFATFRMVHPLFPYFFFSILTWKRNGSNLQILCILLDQMIS